MEIKVELRVTCPKCGGVLVISNRCSVNCAPIWANCGECGYFAPIEGSVTAVMQDTKSWIRK